MVSIIPKIIKRVVRVWDSVVHPYHLYNLSLQSVVFDEKTCEERAIFYVENFKTDINLPLHRVFADDNLLTNLHPLEIAVLEVIAAEEKYLNQNAEFDTEKLMAPFEAFEVVDSCFFSERSGRNMLVLTLDDGEHEVCLSVRDLANQPEYLSLLRDSALLPSISFMEEARQKALR